MKVIRSVSSLILSVLLVVSSFHVSVSAEEPAEDPFSEQERTPAEMEEEPSSQTEPESVSEESERIQEETETESPETDPQAEIPEEEPSDDESMENSPEEMPSLESCEPDEDPERDRESEIEVSQSDRTGRKEILNHGMEEVIEELQEGTDYEAGELVLYTSDRDYAEKTAEIYGGELSLFHDGIAVITVSKDAKELALQSLKEDTLPLVELNYLSAIDLPSGEPSEEGAGVLGTVIPKERLWADWVYDVFPSPDPYLLNPDRAEYQWFHEMIGTYSGWNATMGSDAVTVGVIDYSIYADHEDLAGRVMSEDIGCGYYLGSGHGTMVAGLIAAAADNGKGGAGIAPKVNLLSINIFKNTATAKASDIYTAIIRAVDKGVDVINFSVGSNRYSWTEEMAVSYAWSHGVPLVAACGNNGTNNQMFPAASDKVIAVAAVDRNGAAAKFSNYGPWITVAAPGTEIYSTSATWYSQQSDYAVKNGTSFAAPQVTGALALYISKCGHLSPSQAISLLQKSAVPAASDQLGAGILSIEKMFSASTSPVSIHVFNANDEEVSDLRTPLQEGSYLTIESESPGDQDLILYTLDGTAPAIREGEVIRGTVYEPGSRISIDSFLKNARVTITARSISSLGAAGKSASLSVYTPVPAPAEKKIRTVALNEKSAELSLGGGQKEVTLETSILRNTDGTDVDLDSIAHQWVSSAPSIAGVDEAGTVTALKKGSAVITLKLLDGSRKTASCRITVHQYAEEIVISGQNSMSPGSRAQYRKTVLPSSADRKAVTWTIREEIEGIHVSVTGIVTVRKTVAPGTVFTLQAAAKDGSEVIGTKVIEVTPKASSLVIHSDDPRAVYDKKGVLASAVVFTSDLKDSGHPEPDNELQLTSEITGNTIPPLWTSSNPKAAIVDQSGKVTGIGKGTAVITCKAMDGSGKKAKVTVSVRVPVSGIRFAFGNYTNVAVGKKLKLSSHIGFGSAYGTPTVRKATYEITKVLCTGGYGTRDITGPVLQDQSIRITGDTLSVRKSLLNHADPEEETISVTVKAVCQDGTGFETEDILRVTPVLQGFLFDPPQGGYYECSPDSTSNAVLFSQYSLRYQLTSSRPGIVGGVIDYDSEFQTTFSYRKNGRTVTVDGYGYLVRIYTYPEKTGTAVLTVKALDGSNQTARLRVKVE